MGERARAARGQLGLNQSEVAERVGISIEVYGRFERGLITPRLSTFLRLCDVLRVQPNDLLLADAPAVLRNDSISPAFRQLAILLEGADATTIKRVTEVARWLQAAGKTAPRRKGASRAPTTKVRKRAARSKVSPVTSGRRRRQARRSRE
jgi:transcriptional regulator with XRE-family HTH domain